MKISIICATIGPQSEIDSLVQSILRALLKVDIDTKVELILIDQSNEPSKPIFTNSSQLCITHLFNKERGLSLNRNIGLAKATGDWIMIIDSDCLLSEDYFRNFKELTQMHPKVDHFIGRILDTTTNLPLFRSWPKHPRRIFKLALWYYATSVNSIFRPKSNCHRFDENFGLGAPYGSCEDIDFFLRLDTKPVFSPALEVLHPNIFLDSLPSEKLDSYSFGFGALCAKHALPLGLIMLLSSILKKAADALGKRIKFRDFRRAANWRLKGFFNYFLKKKPNKNA